MKSYLDKIGLTEIDFSRSQLFWAMAIVCQVLFWYFALPGPQIASDYVGSLGAGITACLFSFLFLFLLPFVYWWSSGASLKRLGLGLGDWKFGLLSLVVLVPIIAVLVGTGTWDKQLQAFYPIVGKDLAGMQNWVVWFLWYGLFYVAFEFFYRGVLLQGPEEYPQSTRISISIVCCTLIHVGKPFVETIVSLPGSLLFVCLAIRSRSIWYGFVLHWVIGIVNDLGVLWQLK